MINLSILSVIALISAILSAVFIIIYILNKKIIFENLWFAFLMTSMLTSIIETIYK